MRFDDLSRNILVLSVSMVRLNLIMLNGDCRCYSLLMRLVVG